MATTTMAHQAIEHEVEALLARELPDVDLREVQIIGPAVSGTLRVVIDHPDGVDHQLCVATTKALESGGFRDRYGIEVWSPGTEPPLRTIAHFRDAIGEMVALRVVTEGAGRARSVSGTLTAVEEDRVEVSTADEPQWIPTRAIHRARVVERSEP
jgi:ribosome maturation factor RimP